MTEVPAWKPRPDPALTVPLQPGLRAHRHPPDHLRGWVFVQRHIWVDYWGNEHEIGSMPLDYIANVIHSCEERAERIHTIVMLDALCSVLAAQLAGDRDFAWQADQLSLAEEEPFDWLRRTPLLQALARRSDIDNEQRSLDEQPHRARGAHTGAGE